MNTQPSGGAIWKLAPNASTPIEIDYIRIDSENKGRNRPDRGKLNQWPGPRKTAFRKNRCNVGDIARKLGSSANATTCPLPRLW
jgi:hypothetical protein